MKYDWKNDELLQMKIGAPVGALLGVFIGFFKWGVGGAILGIIVGPVLGTIVCYSIPIVGYYLFGIFFWGAIILGIIWLITSLWGVGKP